MPSTVNYYILIENKVGTNYHNDNHNIQQLINYDESINNFDSDNFIFLGISEKSNFSDDDLQHIQSRL